jgi:arylsulfatase
VRKGNWKLVELVGSQGGWELYNLATDRTEQHNLARERSEVVAELAADYDRWAERCDVAPWEEIAPHRPEPKK